MKKLLLMFVLVCSLLGGCGGGGDTAEKVFADMAGNLREMSAILASVTDEASAKAAVAQIEAVRAKMRDCAKRAKTVRMPDAATEKRLNESMLAVTAEVMPSMAASQARLAARPELMAIIGPALEGMENDL